MWLDMLAPRDLRAALGHLALPQHQDLVGVDDGGEAVRHDQRRPVLAHARQAHLNVALRLRVQR